MSLAGLLACREFLYRCDIELCGLVGINNFLRVQKENECAKWTQASWLEKVPVGNFLSPVLVNIVDN